MLSSLITICLFSLAAATPLTTRSTSIYYLTACSASKIQRGEIDYYASTPSSLPSNQAPTDYSILQPSSTGYEHGTWAATAPINLTAAIEPTAYSAPAGTKVGSAVTSDGSTIGCWRLVRTVVYVPGDRATCVADYACYA